MAVDGCIPLERTPPVETETRVSEAIVLVESMSCYMPMQHPSEAKSSRQGVKCEGTYGSASRTSSRGNHKWARVMSSASREIVGSGYSEWPAA
jgi:hypothetical protein